MTSAFAAVRAETCNHAQRECMAISGPRVRALARNGLELDGHGRRCRPTYRCTLNQLSL
jgi:hypothetical protein